MSPQRPSGLAADRVRPAVTKRSSRTRGAAGSQKEAEPRKKLNSVAETAARRKMGNRVSNVYNSIVAQA